MVELELELNKLLLKWRVKAERNRKLRDTNSDKFSEFNFGKAIGACRAYETAIGLIRKINNNEKENK